MKHATSIFATEVDRCKIAARMDGRDAATLGPGAGCGPVPADRQGFCMLADMVAGEPRHDKTPEHDLRRIAIHEAGHCLVARLRDRPVHSVTVVPSPELGFAGCAMIGGGSPVYLSLAESGAQVGSICDVVDQHAPHPGESRKDLESWLRAAHENVVELLAGAAAEVLVFGSPKPQPLPRTSRGMPTRWYGKSQHGVTLRRLNSSRKRLVLSKRRRRPGMPDQALTLYSNDTPSGSFSSNQASAASMVSNTLR
ncbi:hypothetical protein AAFG13_17090 [Bradyrhizobium sp. B124]|uniref:hypothetical protein n=1 Tax=Bradyrhizobium sp. B124 TaxID=3140245 RepID=UPI003183A0F9